jgi:hypothetical protein
MPITRVAPEPVLGAPPPAPLRVARGSGLGVGRWLAVPQLRAFDAAKSAAYSHVSATFLMSPSRWFDEGDDRDGRLQA